MRLVPTVTSLSSSIYNAMRLKTIKTKQMRKPPQLFHLTGNGKKNRTSLLKSTPASSLVSLGKQNQKRASKQGVPCADAPMLRFF